MSASAGPLVCVCVPTYNAARTLPETLDTILAQTYRNISVLIVDNASSDNTLELAAGYAAKDPRVKIYKHTENVGGEGNFNRCIQLAAGEYTALYHSDDLYAPAMIEDSVAFLERNKGAGAVFAMAVNIDEKGEVIKAHEFPRELKALGKEVYDFADIFRTMLKYGNFIFCPSAMARTGVYKDYIKKWDSGGFANSSDADVWLRILQRYTIGILPRPLLRYRVGSVSSHSYKAARAKTGEHGMLRVFESYIEGPGRTVFGENERKDYSLLVLKDNINRAFNLTFSGKRKEALPLLCGLFSPENLLHAAKSSTHIKVIVYGYAVLLFSLLPLSENMRGRLFKARYNG